MKKTKSNKIKTKTVKAKTEKVKKPAKSVQNKNKNKNKKNKKKDKIKDNTVDKKKKTKDNKVKSDKVKPNTAKPIKLTTNLKEKIKEVKASEIQPQKRKYTKHKLSKADIERALKIRDEIVAENRIVFSNISKAALEEFDNFHPCIGCKFIKRGCASLGCGVVMKWLMRADDKKNTDTACGNGNRRIVSEREFYDTTGFRPGIAEEVDELINREASPTTFEDEPIMESLDDDNYDGSMNISSNFDAYEGGYGDDGEG